MDDLDELDRQLPDQTLKYVTLTIRVPDSYLGSDEDLVADLTTDLVLRPITPDDTPLQLARSLVFNTPDDGRQVRFSVRLPEDYTPGELVDEVVIPAAWSSPGPARMQVTAHEAPFDDALDWPSEAAAKQLINDGYQPYSIELSTPLWTPYGLISSIMNDVVLAAIYEEDLDHEHLHGIIDDWTTPGFPQFTAWVTDEGAAALDKHEVNSTVTEVLDHITEHVLLRNWFERMFED